MSKYDGQNFDVPPLEEEKKSPCGMGITRKRVMISRINMKNGNQRVSNDTLDGRDVKMFDFFHSTHYISW